MASKDIKKTKAQLIEELENLRRELIQADKSASKPELTSPSLLMMEKAFETTHTGITITDLSSKIIYANPAEAKMHGYDQEELIGKSSEILGPSELKKRMNVETIRKMKSRSRESINVRKDKSRFPVFLRSDVVKGRGGEPIAVVTTSEDLTERKLEQETQVKSESIHRALVETSPYGIQYSDREGKIVFSNAAHHQILRYEQGELIGKYVWDFTDTEEARQATKEAYSKIISEEPDPTVYYNKNRTKDGRLVDVFIHWNYIRDAKGEITAICSFVSDVSERKRMEEELTKTQKLESLGILAGGIAHDFNNLLTGILGNISVARKNLPPDHKADKVLRASEAACKRAASLTAQLLIFSREGEPLKETAYISDLLIESSSFALRGSNVRCRINLAQDLWPVEIDPGQINQVINNLIINADQAMPEGGVIFIDAQNVSVETETIAALAKGEYIKVTIRDQGAGIPSEYLSKVFDPFFTTKEKGSGLGLSTSYSIIKKHDGLITAESEVEKGAAFNIYLPAYSDRIPAGDDVYKDGDLKAICKKILFMDDQEIVRELAGKMLEKFGCDFEMAVHGEQAIEIYKKALESKEPFEVVILDLTIPGGMGGKKTIEELLKIDPEVKAIVVSGYSNDPVMAGYKKYGFKGVVAKPFKVDEFGKAIHEVLKKSQ